MALYAEAFSGTLQVDTTLPIQMELITSHPLW